ncbi:thioredoxin TrxC [Amphritea balenae]|uniref:Thioredoxin n=1 Tax=Amphritea balenae TaxID=452629 RepID=A0A3P1SP50_9GAMM|nr:thioredoxin TrxC [Amphritea balenae]RRC98840.1 thioredoxin TrxC [Amphritea balenae]GGK62221.1 thiol disulfide reductase thioredoxin [Amphritea balenae]
MTINISCPHCAVTNKLPEDRLADGPKCGKCKQQIFSGKTTDLNAANYNSMLKRNDIPVLVDCWASWCGPCKQFAPTFEQAAQQFEPKIRLAKLDTEAEQSIASQLQIRSIPTLILFRNGKEAARVSGALPLGQLKQWLNQQGVEV